MFSNEDDIFLLLPESVLKPDDTRADGQGGLTRQSFDRLVQIVEGELSVRVSDSDVTPEMLAHPLLSAAASLFVAAYFLRRLQRFQEQANSYFADANIKLSLWFRKIVKRGEDEAGAEIVPGVAKEIIELAVSVPHLRAYGV